MVGLMVGCQPLGLNGLTGAAPTGVKGSKKPPPVKLPGTDLMTPGNSIISNDGAGIISNDGAGIISNDGAGIISNDGAGIISNDGASLTGLAKLPAGIISNDGAGIISNDGASIISNDGASIISNDGAGYRVAALSDSVPVRKQLVYLMTADGKLVAGKDGKPLTAETDLTGRFTFKGIGTRKHLILAIKLYNDKGFVTAVLPRGEKGARTVDLTLASTLTATYIQEQYVRGQADPVATFERLPEVLEASTRAAVQTAVAKAAKPPAELTAKTVVGLVDTLRTQEKAVDAQFAEVKQVLLAGLSDQGAGQSADTLETDASDVAVGPNGQLVFASESTLRVWRKDADGKLQVVAGNGFLATFDGSASGNAPGDGGPATAAPIDPAAIAYAPDGSLLIADRATRRIRKVSTDGTISTVVGLVDWTELRGLVVEPGGSLVVANHSGIWRVPAGGAPALIAGEVKIFNQLKWYFTEPSGDGGKPADARFRNILSLCRDPRNGHLYVFDAGGAVRRITESLIERAAGTGTVGFNQDGKPATESQLNFGGSVACRPDGTLIISDPANHRVRQVANGIMTTLVGNGTAGLLPASGLAKDARVLAPAAMTLGADGALYFVDRGYVRRLKDDSIRTIIGGTAGFDTARPASAVQLLKPSGLSYDAATDTMWVVDNLHIWRWSLADNTMVSTFGGPASAPPFTDGQLAKETSLNLPRSLTRLGADSWALLASDMDKQMGRVLRVDGGVLKSIAGGTSMDNADKDSSADAATIVASDGYMFEHDGWFYYTLSFNGHVRRFKPGGTTEAFAGYGTELGNGVAAKNHRFAPLTALTKGPDGQFYLATLHYLYKIDPVTTLVTHVGGSRAATAHMGPGGLAIESKFDGASGLAWDADGHLYYCEPNQGRVSRIRKDTGLVERVAGVGTSYLSGGTVDTGLGQPTALAFDKQGDLYIADTRHGQIKVVRKAQLPQ